jgi:hypothetical protein
MKSVRITNDTDIDNDWTNFLMGCDNDEELCYNKNNQNGNGSLKKKAHKGGTATIYNTENSDTNNGNDIDRCNPTMSDTLHNLDHKNKSENIYHNNAGDSSDNIKNKCDADNDDDNEDIHEFRNNKTFPHTVEVPACSPIYISTKTKILFINTQIDIKKVFWDIPIMPYASQCCGIIKKQIKFSCTTKEELEEIEAYAQKEIDKNDGFIETQIIEHIDNPDGRIKFKDHRKINIGLSKKDILNCRCKKKRAFFNCFVLIVRV